MRPTSIVAGAEGLILITYRGNEAFFRELLGRRHSIVPDALERNPRSATFEFVDDELTAEGQVDRGAPLSSARQPSRGDEPVRRRPAGPDPRAGGSLRRDMAAAPLGAAQG